MNFSKSLPAIVATCLLTACGGGSSTTTLVGSASTATAATNASNAYLGKRSAALLTAANSLDFFRLVFGSETASPSLLARAEDASAQPVVQSRTGLLQMSQVMVELASGQLTRHRYQARPVNETESCQDGGTIAITGDLNEQTYTGTLQASYNQCRSGNTVINGSAVYSIRSADVNGNPVNFSIGMNALTISGGATAYRMTGGLDIDESNNSWVANVFRQNLTTGKQDLAENVRFTAGAPGYTDISGNFCDGDHGCVTVASLEDLRFDHEGIPLEGEMLMYGAANSKLQVLPVGWGYIDNIFQRTFQLNLDADGDSLFESQITYGSDVLTGNSSTGSTTPAANTAPEIVVGETNRGMTLGGTLQLDASQSRDSEGGLLVYRWTLEAAPAGSTASILTPGNAWLAFTPDKEGTYRLSLKVTDPQGLSSLVDITLTVSGVARRLPYNMIDAEYSDSLERLVAITTTPTNSLQIINLATGQQQGIALPLIPTSVSVSPDGKNAVVGHDGAVTHVDLQQAKILKFVDGIGFEVFDIALGGGGIAYASGGVSLQWDSLYAINLITGVTQAGTDWGFRAASRLRVVPHLNAVYSITTDVSPTDLDKYSIGTLPPVHLYDSPYHGDYNMGTNLWVTEDGLSILTAGGVLFQTAAQQAQDMRYQRTLPDVSQSQGDIYHEVLHADHSQEVAKFVVASFEHSFYTSGGLGAVSLNVYTTPWLNLESSLSLNGLTLDGGGEAVMPQFVFFNSNGTKRYAILTQGTGTYLLPF